MNRWTAAIVLGISLSVTAAACLEKGGKVVESAGEAIQTAAPALPPPWNWLLAAGGSVLALVGGHFANRHKRGLAEAAVKAGQSVDVALASRSPVLKIASDRKWLFPILGAAIAGLKAGGVLPIPGEDLAAIEAMLAVPTAGEFLSDALRKGGSGPPKA